MDKNRWKQIDEIVAAALELPEAEREKFVSEKTDGDQELSKQVLALLEAEKESDNFMANSAINVMARAIADDTTVLTNSLYNKTFGNFKIKSLLGAGGMGEVYLAFDENLKRNIALKILPKHFHENDERVKRFKTEARAIAALNHPNIVTIFDFGEAEGVNYIATEYVEGKTVRKLLDEKPTLKQTLSIISQSLDALSSAHNAGIIHRDIKPENIMVRDDGYIKILDFGLVKLLESEIENDSGLFAKTMEDVIIGTPAYMSPEQACGEKIDHRTDLWSLGLVFYEMLAGYNPFKKQNPKETIQSILFDEPPLLGSTNPELSPELERILQKALEKDADLSYQTATDFRADIRRIKREVDSSPSWTSQSGNRSLSEKQKQSKFLPFLIGVFAVLLIGIGIWYFAFYEQNENPIRWEKAKVTQLTEQLGKEYFPTLSPDGKTFVYASDQDGKLDIYSQRVGSKRSINLTQNSETDDTQPAFSMDGNFIAFRSERESAGIYVMDVTGENLRRISDEGFHPSWSPDGKQIVFSTRGYERPTTRGRSSLIIVDVESGEKKELYNDYANQPVWSPNNKRIAFWSNKSGGRRDIATVSIEGGEPKFITDKGNTNWNPVWSPDGKYLYYSSDRNGNMAFWRVRIDEKSGETLGEAEIILTPAKFNSHLSFSKDGNRLIFVQTDIRSNIGAVKYDKEKKEISDDVFEITKGDYEIYFPHLSANGDQFAFYVTRQNQDDIVSINREGKNWQDLTNDAYFDRYPRFSPNGRQIAFASDRSGIYEIWLMNADGTNLKQITFNNQSSTSFPVWSPDGKKLSYVLQGKTYILDLKKDFKNQTPKTLPESEEVLSFVAWDWSPDGKKIAGIYRPSEEEKSIGYYSFETNSYTKLTDNLDGYPFWMPDSRQFIFANGGKIYGADIEDGEVFEIINSPQKNITNVGVSSDGELLYLTVSSSESNIWLLDNTMNN